MNFSWISYELIWFNFIWNSWEFHVNFIWRSHEVHRKFLCSSNKFRVKLWIYGLIWTWIWMSLLGPVSLRLMTSQFKDITRKNTHAQKYMTVKCTLYGVWVQNFVWNFKGALWNFTQNFEPIHRKICILWAVINLTTYDILELWHLKS